jgi:hypothetical protein
MSLLDLASLVLAPTATKEGKVYSAIPNTGDGDMTFSRGSAATRVNSAGLIEKVRTNLVKYSEEFDNAVWAKTRATITANAGTAPDGTSTADKMIANTANNSHFIDQPITTPTSIPFSFSVFAKAGEYDFLQINNQADNSIANFNLSDGTLGTISGYSASITDSGNGWYRCIATRTFSVSPSTHRIALITSATAARLESFIGDDSSGVYIWGAQYELSDIATEYIPTTSSAVSVGMTDNVPRLDYSGGGCPKLLLEPQRTNLVTYSEDFGAWSANAGGISSIESNYAISPEGVINAYKVNFVVQGDSDLALYIGHSVTGGATYAYSIYIKGEGSNIGKDIVLKSKRSSGDSAGTTTTQTLTGEWVRVDFTTTYAANNTATKFYISSNDATSCLVYGAQAELGSYATSYIPTYSVSSTRVADSCYKTGISELIGQSEGTLFVEFTLLTDDNTDYRLSISDGSSTNWIFVAIPEDGQNTRLYVRINGSVAIDNNTNAFAIGNTYKVAMKYKSGDSAVYVNGLQKITANTTFANTSSTLDSFIISGSSANSNTPQLMSSNLKQVVLFPTALTNDQLADLTTL